MMPRKQEKSDLNPWELGPDLPPQKVLVLDVGGSNVKILATGQTEPRSFRSGKKLTPKLLVEQTLELSHDWEYEAVPIGYPGIVGSHGPRSEPGNLGAGWVGFDFASAFGKPIRILNDAAMQALGSYDGGRMLFLGLGTGLGSALIADNVIIPLELGNLWWTPKKSINDALSKKGFKELGKKKWEAIFSLAVHKLSKAFVVDYLVIGGANAQKLQNLPPGTRLGHNVTAFRGGFRLWSLPDVTTLSEGGTTLMKEGHAPSPWRVV